MLVKAWFLLSLVSLSLRFFGFQRTQDALGPAGAAGASRDDLAEAQAIARIVRAAANRNPFRPKCLARCIVLVRLLRRKGLAADLRIGIAKPDETLTAHAWVEHYDVALAEAEATIEAYAPFDADRPEGKRHLNA